MGKAMIYEYQPAQPGSASVGYVLACPLCEGWLWDLGDVSPTALTLFCMECGRTLVVPLPKTSPAHSANQSLN
jgi:hypothetical protein